jgi:hypothetical protein
MAWLATAGTLKFFDQPSKATIRRSTLTTMESIGGGAPTHPEQRRFLDPLSDPAGKAIFSTQFLAVRSMPSDDWRRWEIGSVHKLGGIVLNCWEKNLYRDTGWFMPSLTNIYLCPSNYYLSHLGISTRNGHFPIASSHEDFDAAMLRIEEVPNGEARHGRMLEGLDTGTRSTLFVARDCETADDAVGAEGTDVFLTNNLGAKLPTIRFGRQGAWTTTRWNLL